MVAVFGRAVKSVAGLFDRSFDPARARRLPVINEAGESNVRGLYLVGEIAGSPLIKLGLNRGRAVVDHIARGVGAGKGVGARFPDGGPPPDVREPQGNEPRPLSRTHDILIVGAGSSGLGAADRCAQLGLDYVVIEQERPAQLIRNFTKGKPLYMEPPGEENQTRLFCEECPKETLLAEWDRQIVDLGLGPHIRTFETVEDIQRLGDPDGFRVTTTKGTYHARRVVLAIGMAGNPRRLGVPGEEEHAARISANVADPDACAGQELAVFGAGDVACEAAIALADGGNRVLMVAPDQEFTYPKQRNIDGVLRHADAGAIDLHLGHVATAVDAESVSIRDLESGATSTHGANHVFRCIGADLPLPFFARIGVRLEGTWHLRRWLLLVAMFVLCYIIYGSKSNPALWPFNVPLVLFGSAEHPVTFVRWWGNLHIGEGRWAFKLNGSFWYSFAYCILMTVFGLKAYHRWGVRYDDSYQKKRFASLIIVQWTLAFLIPMGLMWWLHGVFGDNPILGRRDNWWHASGFEYAFPLFFQQFFFDVGWLYLVYGLAATLIIIPLTTIWHGKRYCTWFCGCGGLAETLGDPWRHLAPKGKVSQRWEWMNLAILIWATIAIVLVVAKIGLGKFVSGSYFVPPGADAKPITAALYHGYARIADLWLVGIIPIALYPIYGGKIWCRYWCPLARWMQMTSKWFGTLQISSNEKCITCGECSRYCQVGIDVMSFAKSQESFHNGNSSCIHCGICITVCPMDVLSFDRDGQGSVMRRLRPQAGVALTVDGKPALDPARA